MTYNFYPKELLQNSLEGFNLIPLIRDPENGENAFRINLDVTPFADYSRNVIETNARDYIDTNKAVELQTFVLCRFEDKWLITQNTKTKKVNLGLLKHLVNRGQEQSELAFRLNSLQVPSGDYTLAVLGYIYAPETNSCIFILRYDFSAFPTPQSKNETFIELSPEALVSEASAKMDFDDLSTYILDELRAVLAKDSNT